MLLVKVMEVLSVLLLLWMKNVLVLDLLLVLVLLGIRIQPYRTSMSPICSRPVLWDLDTIRAIRSSSLASIMGHSSHGSIS